MLVLTDDDIWDRAVAYDSPTLALQTDATIASPPHHSSSRALTIVLGIVAVIGWGAFLFERTKALPQWAPTVSSDTAAPADALLEARPLKLVARAARTVRPVRPPAALLAASRFAPPPAAKTSSPPAPAAPAMDVSGAWLFVTQTKTGTRVNSQRFHVELTQDGGRVYGVGRPVTATGAETTKTSKSPITIRGTMTQELTLTFRDSAARRGAPPTYVLRPQDDGHLRGRVTTSRSGASVEAHRR
jgi:hypothetical protein